MVRPMFPPNTPDPGPPKPAQSQAPKPVDQDTLFLQNLLLWAQWAAFQNDKQHNEHQISDDRWDASAKLIKFVADSAQARLKQKQMAAAVSMMGLAGRGRGTSSQEVVGDNFMGKKTLGVPHWGWGIVLASVGLFHISK